MRRSTLLALILTLAFLGIADAGYLAQAALTDTALNCGIDAIDGCNTVAQSEYSHLFGIPLGVYGVLFYGLLFILAAVALARPARLVARLMLAVSALGLLASSYFLYLQIFVIKALCIYCIASAGIAFLLLVATLLLFRREHHAAVAASTPEPQLPAEGV